MKNGKKSVAEKIFYGALDEISSRDSEMSSLEIFKAAIENVMPSVEVNTIFKCQKWLVNACEAGK